MTLAEILGGMAGLLFAAIIFALQFHGERLGQASFLVRYLGRREGVIPIAAFTLAVVGVNAIAGVFANTISPAIIQPVLWMDFTLAPSVLLLSLWLLHRMVISVSGDFFEQSLIPGLTYEFERGLDEDTRQSLLVRRFASFLSQVGLERSGVLGFIAPQTGNRLEFVLKRRGRIVDIHLGSLRKLAKLISDRCVSYTATVCVGPDDDYTGQIALVMEAKEGLAGRPREPTQLIDRRLKAEIQKLADAAFHFGFARSTDVVDVLSRFSKTILQQAKHDTAEQFRRCLDVQLNLAELRLSRPESLRPEVSFHRAALPDFVGSLSSWDTTHAVVESGDRDKMDVLLQFAGRLMTLGVERSSSSLLRHGGEIFASAYWHSRHRAELKAFVSESIDTYLFYVLSQFHRGGGRRSVHLRGRDVSPMLAAAIAWVLQLISMALQHREVEDAKHFHERIFEWDRHGDARMANREELEEDADAHSEIINLYSYAEFVVAALSLQLIGAEANRNAAAVAVFQAAVGTLGTKENVLQVWEWSGSDCDGQLLVEQLGLRLLLSTGERMRAGQSRAITGNPYQWLSDGLVPVLLACPSATERESRLFLETSPQNEPQEIAAVEKRIAEQLADSVLRRDVLRIPDDAGQSAGASVKRLFALRWCRFKCTKLERVVNAILPESQGERLRLAIAANLRSPGDFVSYLLSIGVSNNQATCCTMYPAALQNWVPKEWMLQNLDASSFLALEFTKTLGRFETNRLEHACETHASLLGVLGSPSETLPSIRLAIDELRARGNSPSLILIPRQRRFRAAVTGTAYGHLPGAGRFGDLHIGSLDGCEVFLFNYRDPTSIVVVDAVAFWGAHEVDTNRAVSLLISDPEAKKHLESLIAAERETDPSRIPDLDQIRVLAKARLLPRAGLRTIGAAIRFDLDLAQVGYAMANRDEFCHLASCGRLAGADGRELSIYPAKSDEAESRKPCPDCKPRIYH